MIDRIENKCNKFIVNLTQKISNIGFKKIFIIVLVLTTVLSVMHVFQTVSYANVDSGIAEIEEFEKLEGTGEFIKKEYRNNYYLDIYDASAFSFEKAINGLANVLFSLTAMFAYLAVSIFYYCFEINIADLFGKSIDDIQKALQSSIFDQAFIVAFIFIGIYLTKQFAKRNIAEILSQLAKVIFVIILASLLVENTSTILKEATNISKDIGKQAMISISGEKYNEEQEFASVMAGKLWYSLVHEPWMMIEGGNLTKDQQKQLLKEDPSSDSREEIIKNIRNTEGNGDFCDEKMGTSRVPQAILVLIIVVLKAGVLLVLALIQISFQVLAVLCILFSVVALVLSLVPQLGGLTIIENLIKRIFETQLGIVITTFMIAVLTKVDTLILQTTQDTLKCGWLIALLLQAAMYICVYLYRNQILKLITTTYNNTKNGHIAPPDIVPRIAQGTGEKLTDYKGAKQKIQKTGRGIRKTGRGIRKASTGVAKGVAKAGIGVYGVGAGSYKIGKKAYSGIKNIGGKLGKGVKASIRKRKDSDTSSKLTNSTNSNKYINKTDPNNYINKSGQKHQKRKRPILYNKPKNDKPDDKESKE